MEVPVAVIEDTEGRTLGIDEVARLTGLPVRTIRFYCDEGVLESARSAGGHRRFDTSAVDRLGLVRRLRRLGLGLPAIKDVVAGERSVSEVVTAERAALDVELGALAWRHASLRAVEDAAPADRAARLELLAAVQDGRAGYDAIVQFWSRSVVLSVPAGLLSAFVAMIVPEPPVIPTPGQVVAYAEMVALVEDRSLRRNLLARARINRETIADEVELLTRVGEVCEMVEPLVLAGQPPGPGDALDRFVEVHAAVRGDRDTQAFRQSLLRNVAVDRDPRLRRYWGLFGELTGDVVTPGAIHGWLLDALELSVEAR